ncbi:L-serine dehydratase/L-threonine deaminase-like protein [Anaeromyces robustus]|uniref:L-serine ammonia-lyase n=1 Tax=Anaeromyces robustus TaxID=1754192 RepID=A0A1Y1XM97_9FUNG|nr:L-serine dehydratase/L-threonine deaminase-like protein [Anaeromyces robustus]|eukprot:ORX86815.1 L-serine dehydratase/L-threonine deaminase-like protein [Anaeromyces robustus]
MMVTGLNTCNPRTLFSELPIYTPLHYSNILSSITGSNVYLKLENLQVCNSFKIRGVGYMCSKVVSENNCQMLVSSGINAGIACAYAGKKLNTLVTIFLPINTPEFIIEKIQDEGASVIIKGKDFEEADLYAKYFVEKTQYSCYIPPYDHPDIWEGNSSIIDEIKSQLGDTPDAIITVVGGGGLLCGLIQGCQKVRWENVPIIAVETHDTNSFQLSTINKKVTELPKGSEPLANSLNIKKVCSQALNLSNSHPVVPITVSDAMSIHACRKFADDHKMLIEPSSAAAVSLCYSNIIHDIIEMDSTSKIVVIITGGNNISLAQLENSRYKCSSPVPIVVKSGSEIYMKLNGSN